MLTRADLEKAGYEINKNVWTEDEDKLLVYLREKKKMDWIQISKKIPERNKKMCYSRYRRLKNSTKLQWLRKDDEKLVGLVDSLGENWDEITKHFKSKPFPIKTATCAKLKNTTTTIFVPGSQNANGI